VQKKGFMVNLRKKKFYIYLLFIHILKIVPYVVCLSYDYDLQDPPITYHTLIKLVIVTQFWIYITNL